MGRESRQRAARQQQGTADTELTALLRRIVHPPPVQPPGTVVMLATGAVRYTTVAQCFAALELPPGTSMDVYSGNCNVWVNRNEIIKAMSGDWLLMIDDDQVFLPNLAQRLLRHLNDDRVDIVAPVMTPRSRPYDLVGKPAPVQGPLCVNQMGLLPMDVVGTGVILIRRRVFERIPGPNWFESTTERDNVLTFCHKAREHGCGIFCDMSTRVGHLTQAVIWPTRRDGKWFGEAVSMSPVGTRAQIVQLLTKQYADTEPTGGAVADGEGI
jgi:hypothetical protein